MIKGDQVKKIILASKSPRRQELLNQIGIPYEVVASKVDEKCVGDLPPDQLVEALAKIKAEDVAKNLPLKQEDFLVIGADTIVVLDNKILGKPISSVDAKNMLQSLSGKMHKVYTGVAIIDTKSSTWEVFTQKTKVYMKTMTLEEIEAYVLTKEPLDKAGSYGIQGKGGVFVEKIEGDYFSVMGLPIGKLYDYLKKFR